MSGKQDRFSQKWYQRTLRDKIDRGANLYDPKKDQQEQVKLAKNPGPKAAEVAKYYEYKTAIKKIAAQQWVIDEASLYWPQQKEPNYYKVDMFTTVRMNISYDSFYNTAYSKPPSRVVDSIET